MKREKVISAIVKATEDKDEFLGVIRKHVGSAEAHISAVSRFLFVILYRETKKILLTLLNSSSLFLRSSTWWYGALCSPFPNIVSSAMLVLKKMSSLQNR